MNITMQGKYTTRDGRAARILCVDGPRPDYPVAGFIADEHTADSWTADGHMFTGIGKIIYPSDDLDLIPVPAKHEGWMAISNKTGLPLADARRGVWLDRSDAIAFCNQADEHVILVTWFS